MKDFGYFLTIAIFTLIIIFQRLYQFDFNLKKRYKITEMVRDDGFVHGYELHYMSFPFSDKISWFHSKNYNYSLIETKKEALKMIVNLEKEKRTKKLKTKPKSENIHLKDIDDLLTLEDIIK